MNSNALRYARRRPLLLLFYRWIAAFIDPVRFAVAVRELPRYITSWVRYSRLQRAETLSALDSYPCLADRTPTTPFDAHYFHQAVWATRKLREASSVHLDIGSQLSFVGMLSAIRPVAFVDIRPLATHTSGLMCVSANGVRLPFGDGSIASVSCLHVAEHIGLGRYGDELDAEGTVRLCGEIARVVADGGSLLFAVPVGRERVCFNAHRVISPTRVEDLFPEFELVDFSFVDDEGQFHWGASTIDAIGLEYGCGLYHFARRQGQNSIR